jgi:hypothetical protein
MSFGVIHHFLEMDRQDRQRYPELYELKGPSTISFVNPNATGTAVQSSPQWQVTSAQLSSQRNLTDSIPAETAHIKDYMCWSFVNIFLGGLFLGFISLLLSSTVRNHKIAGRVEEAQSMSDITMLWNGFLTLAGITGIVAFSLYASGHL